MIIASRHTPDNLRRFLKRLVICWKYGDRRYAHWRGEPQRRQLRGSAGLKSAPLQEHDALRERWVVWLLVQVYTAHQYTEDNVAAVACVRVNAVVDDEDKEDGRGSALRRVNGRLIHVDIAQVDSLAALILPQLTFPFSHFLLDFPLNIASSHEWNIIISDAQHTASHRRDLSLSFRT